MRDQSQNKSNQNQTAEVTAVENDNGTASNICANDVTLPFIQRARNNPRNLTPGEVLRLQRTVGNQAVQRLLASSRENQKQRPEQRPVAPKAANEIQRKVFISAENNKYTEYTDQNDPQIASMVTDNKTRRFENEAELQKFNQGGLTNIGYLDTANQWLRLDSDFTVLGENHDAATTALHVVGQLGIASYRHEAFVDIDETRLQNSPDLTQNVAADVKEKADKYGLGNIKREDHAAEIALPKFARTLPDFRAMVIKQGNDEEVGQVKIKPGTQWPAKYSLARQLADKFLTALIYAKSFPNPNKFMGPQVSKFSAKYSQAIDNSIAMLGKNGATNVIPDYSQLPIIGAGLDAMITAYREDAMKAVGLKNQNKVEEWKGQLDTKKEAKVTLTDEAKEVDYLRDKSLFDHILASKQGGDLVFGLGEAHLTKLTPLLKDKGIKYRYLDELLTEEKTKDVAAEQNLNVGDAGVYQKFMRDNTEPKGVTSKPGQLSLLVPDLGTNSVKWDWSEFSEFNFKKTSVKNWQAVACNEGKEAKKVTLRLVLASDPSRVLKQYSYEVEPAVQLQAENNVVDNGKNIIEETVPN